MKPTGIIELVIIVTALVMGLPLFIACMVMANRDLTTEYLNDKTAWEMTPDIDWEYDSTLGRLVPISGIDAMHITAAQAAMMPYIQDEYTPNESRVIEYANGAVNSVAGDDVWLASNDKYIITLPPNVRATRYLDIPPLFNKHVFSGTKSEAWTLKDEQYYLTYKFNGNEDGSGSWFINRDAGESLQIVGFF